MTMARIKRMKETIQSLISEMHSKVEVLQGLKKILEVVNVRSSIITYL